MKEVDYIIVGQGLAGTVLSFQLRQLDRSILVVDKHRASTSSKVAPGAYNPMVLKRFTPCWKVEEQLGPLYSFIEQFELHYKTCIHQPLKLLRKFQSVQEQNLWMEKCEKTRLAPYMNPQFKNNNYKNVIADFGFGEVNHAGRVVLPKMISIFREDLVKTKALIDESFDYEALIIKENSVEYRGVQAKNIVFCEGHRLTTNTYFNYLPLMRTKGELLTAKIEGLSVKELLKSNVSVLPLGDDFYKLGATFNWEDKDELCTEEGKRELLDKLKQLVSIEPQIIKHEAGLRPTVKDRRALLGRHPKYKNLFIFNGLGTRGLLISPYLSLMLIDLMEHGKELDSEINIKRYENELSC